MNNLLARHPLPWYTTPDSIPIKGKPFALPLLVMDAEDNVVMKFADKGKVAPVDREKADLFAAAPAMLKALRRLLDCPDLNLDELEDETRAAIQEAENAWMDADGQDNAAQILGSADPRA